MRAVKVCQENSFQSISYLTPEQEWQDEPRCNLSNRTHCPERPTASFSCKSRSSSIQHWWHSSIDRETQAKGTLQFTTFLWIMIVAQISIGLLAMTQTMTRRQFNTDLCPCKINRWSIRIEVCPMYNVRELESIVVDSCDECSWKACVNGGCIPDSPKVATLDV